MAALNGMGRHHRARRVRVCAAALACAALCLAVPAAARLASTKAQESAMIARIVPVTEKWLRHINDSFDKNEALQDEITAIAKDLGSLENGIFNDMYIGTDVARLLVYAQRKDPRLVRALDDFDRGADLLCAGDRLRYYTAKARLYTEKLSEPPDSLKRDWLARLVNDCASASRNGLDADKSLDMVRKFIDRNAVKAVVLDEPSCRIHQDYGRFFLAAIKSLRAQGKHREAFESALQAVREIPPLSNLDFGACGVQKSDAELCAAYDRNFVLPLSSYLGRNKDELQTEVCRKYWEHKKLVSLVLTRIATPLPDA
jgi:hypothetical protein